MSEKSEPIPIPPPNNERTSWFGWGNSFYTPNKNIVENIVPMDDNEKISSSSDNESDNEYGNESDNESDNESNDPFEDDISQEAIYKQFRKLLMSKNKCQQFRDFMVNAPDVIVMWGMMTTACIFRAPEAFFISLFWYATEKDKHQKEQQKLLNNYGEVLAELNDKEKLNKQD